MNIAECTIALKSNKHITDVVNRDYNAYADTLHYIGSHNGYYIYVMDSNGCPLEVEDYVCSQGGIFEINYLDGDGPYTENGYKESDETLAEILQVPTTIRDKIVYSN